VRPAQPHPSGGPGPDRDRPVPDEASIRRFLATSRCPAGAQLPPASRCPGARCPSARFPRARFPGAHSRGIRCPGARSPGIRCPGARWPGIRFAGPGQPRAIERSPAACPLAIRFPAAGQPRASPRPPTATPRPLVATTRPLAATLRPPAGPAVAEPASQSPATLPRPAPSAPLATPAGRARVSPAGPRPRTRPGADSSCHPSRALSFSLASAVVPGGACAPLRPPPPPMAAVGPARTGAVDRARCDIAVTGPLTSRYSPRVPPGVGELGCAEEGSDVSDGAGPQAQGPQRTHQNRCVRSQTAAGPGYRGYAPAVVTIHARTRASSCHLS
jgi:hypothetical protein